MKIDLQKYNVPCAIACIDRAASSAEKIVFFMFVSSSFIVRLLFIPVLMKEAQTFAVRLSNHQFPLNPQKITSFGQNVRRCQDERC